MKHCREYENELLAYALNDETGGAFAEHVLGCAGCAARLQQLRAVVQRQERVTLPTPARNPRIGRFFRHRTCAAPRRSGLRFAIAAGAVALVAIGIFALMPARPPAEDVIEVSISSPTRFEAASWNSLRQEIESGSERESTPRALASTAEQYRVKDAYFLRN